MDYFIIGISHHLAPVAVRERFAGVTLADQALVRLSEQGIMKESLVISTCNRWELVAVTDQPVEWRQRILEALGEVSGLAVADFQACIYEYENLSAVRHLFRVGGSLDSLVLGEPQILGQVKDAYRQSHEQHRSGTFLNKLMHKCFQAAKRVRSETSLTGGSVSVAGAAVALARSIEGGNLTDKNVLILGAGPMAALAVAHMGKRNPASMTLANRTRSKAMAIGAEHGACIIGWEEVDESLLQADLVICAVKAPEPILTMERLNPILAKRPKCSPLAIIDIGVPRNAAHELKHHPRVNLKNIDDLNEVVWENQAARSEAARRAEDIIDEEVAKFGNWLDSQASQPTVAALARKAENIRRLELDRTLGQHQFSPEQVVSLEAMTGAIVRRLLHDPLAYVKNSLLENTLGASQCREANLDYLQRAFNLKVDP